MWHGGCTGSQGPVRQYAAQGQCAGCVLWGNELYNTLGLFVVGKMQTGWQSRVVDQTVM